VKNFIIGFLLSIILVGGGIFAGWYFVLNDSGAQTKDKSTDLNWHVMFENIEITGYDQFLKIDDFPFDMHNETFIARLVVEQTETWEDWRWCDETQTDIYHGTDEMVYVYNIVFTSVIKMSYPTHYDIISSDVGGNYDFNFYIYTLHSLDDFKEDDFDGYDFQVGDSFFVLDSRNFSSGCSCCPSNNDSSRYVMREFSVARL